MGGANNATCYEMCPTCNNKLKNPATWEWIAMAAGLETSVYLWKTTALRMLKSLLLLVEMGREKAKGREKGKGKEITKGKRTTKRIKRIRRIRKRKEKEKEK